MNGVKLCFSGAIALGVVVAFGCSSSSTQPPGPVDSGPVAETGPVEDAGLDGSDNTHCDPLLGKLCGATQTCCFAGLTGTCVENGACTAPFQFQCITKADCNGGVCCATVQFPAGFDASAFDASGFDASGFDASAFDASSFDASGFGIALSCSASCPAPSYQLCMTSQDCPTGERCSGGPGGPGAGFSQFVMVCIPVDAGVGPDDSGADAADAEASAAGSGDGG